MDIEWSDIAVTILWLLVLVGAGAFAYCILFWDRLASRDDPERIKKGWIFRIAMVFNYALVIGVPAIMLVGFVPVMSEAKHLGLTPQDMDLARQYSDTRERLPALKGYLPRLDQALDQPSAPIWEQVKAYVIPQLGGEPRFNCDLWKTLIDWGRQIEQDRGDSDAVVPETRAIRAALARLIGGDDLPERIATFRQRCGESTVKKAPRDPSVVDTYVRYAMTLHVFYPNEDIAYLAFADGFRRRPMHSNIMMAMVSLLTAALVIVLALFIQRGTRVLSVRLLGKLLGLERSTLFHQFEHEAFNPYRFLLGFALIFPMTALFAWIAIEPYYVLAYRQPWSYFTAVAWNVLIGGVLVETLGNVLSVVLIRCGRDPLRMVLDNLIVAALSVPLLLYFQNSWYAIAAGIALGILQSIAEKITVRYALRRMRIPPQVELDRPKVRESLLP